MWRATSNGTQVWLRPENVVSYEFQANGRIIGTLDNGNSFVAVALPEAWTAFMAST